MSKSLKEQISELAAKRSVDSGSGRATKGADGSKVDGKKGVGAGVGGADTKKADDGGKSVEATKGKEGA